MHILIPSTKKKLIKSYSFQEFSWELFFYCLNVNLWYNIQNAEVIIIYKCDACGGVYLEEIYESTGKCSECGTVINPKFKKPRMYKKTSSITKKEKTDIDYSPTHTELVSSLTPKKKKTMPSITTASDKKDIKKENSRTASFYESQNKQMVQKENKSEKKEAISKPTVNEENKPVKKETSQQEIKPVSYVHIPVAKQQENIKEEIKKKNKTELKNSDNKEQPVKTKKTVLDENKMENISLENIVQEEPVVSSTAPVHIQKETYEEMTADMDEEYENDDEYDEFEEDDESEGIFAHLVDGEISIDTKEQNIKPTFLYEEENASEEIHLETKENETLANFESKNEKTLEPEVLKEDSNIMLTDDEIEETNEADEDKKKSFSAAEWLKSIRDNKSNNAEKMEYDYDFNFNDDGFYNDTVPAVEAKPDVLSKQIVKKVFAVGLALFLIIAFLIYYA